MAGVWPSREEWQAKAEYSVRTFCTRWERLEPGTVWSTLAEDIELEEVGALVAKSLRPLLTAEIGRLKAAFPERPSKGRERGLWLIDLPEDQYAQACDLGALEGIRTEIGRDARNNRWGWVGFQAGRIRKHYRAIELSADLLAAIDRMNTIADAAESRRDAEARRLEDEAVVREVAKRATDEGWAKELERRARIESPRVIHIGQTPPAEGDQVT